MASFGRQDRPARSSGWLAALLLCAVPLEAQRATKYENPTHGFSLKVPEWMESIPLKPGESQVLAQFNGRKKGRHKVLKGERELGIYIVRIRKSAPKTGENKADPFADRPKSLSDQRTAWVNSATNLDELLERRELPSGLFVNKKYFRKPIQDSRGQAYKVRQKSSPRGAKYGVEVRAFVTEDPSEIFGMLAIGEGAEVFEREITAMLKSLKRMAPTASGDEPAEDPYTDSKLRDLEKRRAVRSKLVEGWKAYDTENFLLLSNIRDKRLIQRMLVDLEVMRSAYLERFPPAKDADMTKVSTVRVCDGYEDYLRYAGEDMDGTGGYWNFMDEELVLFNPESKVPKALRWTKGVDAREVLYHEAMHQYFHYSNSGLAPGSWFNEGYGEVFGGAKVNVGKRKIVGILPNAFRVKFIKLDRKQKRAIPQLYILLRMTKSEFYGHRSLANYAYGWAFCYFLEQERKKPKKKRKEEWAGLPDRYIDALRRATESRRAKMPKDAPKDWIFAFKDEIQAEAIEAALAGVDMDKLQEAYERLVKSLR